MYYPSFFAGVRPFETLRERVDNPLDLSVKQTVSRSEGSCPAEHEDLQLLMERKLAVAAGLPSQQMPLLDNMFAYKPFGTESMSCQMRRTDLLAQNLNPSFCTTTPSGHPINHLGLVPDILHQNRDALTMEAAAPPLTSFAMNTSGIPYHMRIGSAVMANQRAYYGHSSVLPPHMSAPFNASLPHIPLYTDLMSGLTRRPVEPETSVFGALSSLRGPPDPSTQFSDHLQRLRGQHIQQSKCSAPCCMPSTLHTSGANHSNNGCSCCDVGLAMPSNVSTLILPPSHATVAPSVPVSVSVSCNDVSNRDMIPSNSNPNTISHCLKNKNISNKNNEKNIFGDNSFLIKSQSFKQKDFQLKSQSCSERHTSQKTDIECNSSVAQNSHLSVPSHYNKSVFQPIDCFNNETDKCDPISNSSDRQKEIFCLKTNISDKFKKESIFSQNNNQEVITLDEEISESETENISHKDITIDSRHKYERKTKCQLTDNQIQPIICSTDRTLNYDNTYDSFNPNANKHRLELYDQNSGQNLNQTNVLSNDLKGDNNPTNINKLETNSQILEHNNDCPNKNISNTILKPELNKREILYSDQKTNESNPMLGSTQLEPNIKESECTPNIQNGLPEERPKTSNESAVSVKSVTKQLKDYKPVTKHMNITAIDKNKRQAKETKTVEVQCDGPDWTPIVLPQQLKNKLHKVVRNKRLFGNNSIQFFKYKNNSKKRKTCKQKHFHRKQSRSRSRSSSVSSNWSRKSSPERHSNGSNSSSKAKKRSMLQCLSNSEGYVADKIKKTDLQPNLIASDPSQLGREERALQRAIKHIEDLNKPYTRDNSAKNNAKNCEMRENNEINLINNITDKSADSNDECILSMKKISETYQKIIESVVYESRLQNHFSEETNKKSKGLDSNVNSGNSDGKEPVSKSGSKKKRKLKQQIIEKLLDDDKQGIQQNITFKTKKKRVEQNNEKCDNEVTKTDANASQQTVVNKQKKGIVTVRRRRFRSGLDMIRNAHRRKKSRNQIQASISKQESNRCESLETTKENIQKLSCDATNGSVPTEMKRLMVNKALGETLLHRAARSNRLDVVNFCLQSSTCDVNARDNANYTPLHECSTRGNLQIARILLQNGADVNASAAGGIRPIHDAIENNHIEVVRLLLSYGADPNISTYSGSTAIELSRSKAMLTFLKGFLNDISSDCQTESKKEVMSWKFNGSANILDTKQTGFDVLDGLSSDEVEEESHDFLFEVSESPMDPTYRLPNLRSKGSDHFMLLSDVLNRTRLTKDEFLKTHSDIEILTVTKHDLEAATIEQILTKCKTVFNKKDSLGEDIVILDDKIRNILGIETLTLKSI